MCDSSHLFRRLTPRSATGKSQRDFPTKIKHGAQVRPCINGAGRCKIKYIFYVRQVEINWDELRCHKLDLIFSVKPAKWCDSL